MTIENETSTVTHVGNGATTEWPYTFKIPDAESIEVGLFEIATELYTILAEIDYSVTGYDDPNGGEVTYPIVGTPLAATHRLVISRKVPFIQETNLTNQTPYYPEVLEQQLDFIVMMCQQMKADIGRAVLVTQGSSVDPNDLIASLIQAAANATAQAAAAAASAGAASSSAAAAQASADLAASFIPSNYWTKTESYSKTEVNLIADDLSMDIYIMGNS